MREKMKQFSKVVYTALTLAVCLLAVVNALPVLAESAVEEPHTVPAAGDEEQISANEEDINAGKCINVGLEFELIEPRSVNKCNLACTEVCISACSSPRH